MVDLTSEMAQLWASLGPPPPGRARVVQFAAARSGEGTSTVAREFARLAVGRATKPVWLVDLDLMGPGQAAAIAAERAQYGPLGKAAAATPDGSVFFTVQPPARDRAGRPIPDARYLTARPVGGRKLWVTDFRKDALRGGPARPPAAQGRLLACAAAPRRPGGDRRAPRPSRSRPP